VHVPTRNEPPELVLETLRSLQRLEYPAFEVLVLDNNTADESLWRPIERYCREVGFHFVHLEDWPGFKAGALNHGLRITDDRAEIVAVVDADFVVEPDLLARTVGYFAQPDVAIVQTRQEFRAEADSDYFRRLALTYRAFDEVTMPSRNERNAIIFAGTMGLIRRAAVVEAGGWGEWCVTEDAELSLRLLARGHRAVYVERTFGRGVMPLTFAALKRQRFRWCFGGIQILRSHWKLLLYGRDVAPDGTELRLTPGQRYDYLTGSLQWFQALVTVVFAAFLLVGAALTIATGEVALRPLVGLFVAAPALLLVSSLVKAMWGLRTRLGVGWRDAVGALGVWLALTWAVALGCLQGITRREGAFLRTPKFKHRDSVREALATAKAETALTVILLAAAASSAAARADVGGLFLAGLCVWSAVVFASAPAAAFAASRTELRSGALRARRRLETESPQPFIQRRPLRYAVAGVGAAALFATTATTLSVVPERVDLGQAFELPSRDGAASKASSDHAAPLSPRAVAVDGRVAARATPSGAQSRRADRAATAPESDRPQAAPAPTQPTTTLSSPSATEPDAAPLPTPAAPERSAQPSSSPTSTTTTAGTPATPPTSPQAPEPPSSTRAASAPVDAPTQTEEPPPPPDETPVEPPQPPVDAPQQRVEPPPRPIEPTDPPDSQPSIPTPRP